MAGTGFLVEAAESRAHRHMASIPDLDRKQVQDEHHGRPILGEGHRETWASGGERTDRLKPGPHTKHVEGGLGELACADECSIGYVVVCLVAISNVAT